MVYIFGASYICVLFDLFIYILDYLIGTAPMHTHSIMYTCTFIKTKINARKSKVVVVHFEYVM